MDPVLLYVTLPPGLWAAAPAAGGGHCAGGCPGAVGLTPAAGGRRPELLELQMFKTHPGRIKSYGLGSPSLIVAKLLRDSSVKPVLLKISVLSMYCDW